MAKQINFPIATASQSEIITPPAGQVAFFIDENGVPRAMDENRDIADFVAGVTSINGKIGVATLKEFDITQWRRNVGSIVVPDNSTFNIFEGFTSGDKIAPVSTIGPGEINITSDPGEDFIQLDWQNVIEAIFIRVIIELQQGGTDYYRLILRRKADDSIISVHPFSMNSTDQPEDINTINIDTYVGSASDSFVTGGFYIQLANDSGGSVTIANNLDLKITRTYKQAL